MAEETLTKLAVVVSMIFASAIPAFFIRKIGPIAVWCLTTSFMIIAFAFSYPIEIIMGLGVLSVLTSMIVLVLEA